jgi:hypothetical protein
MERSFGEACGFCVFPHPGTLHKQVKDRLGVRESNTFALYQVQRGTHFLLHEDAQVAEIKSSTDPRAKALGMRDKRPKMLLKKFLFTKHDEQLISEKAFIHLFYIQVRSATDWLVWSPFLHGIASAGGQ